MNEIFDAMIFIDIDEKTQWKRRLRRARDLAKQYPDKEGMGMDTNYEVLPVYAFVEDRERIEREVKNRRYGEDFGNLGWLKLYFDDVLWPSTCLEQFENITLVSRTSLHHDFQNYGESP